MGINRYFLDIMFPLICHSYEPLDVRPFTIMTLFYMTSCRHHGNTNTERNS